MIPSFYQIKTVTGDAVTAQIPNPSRTAHACTHEEFIKTGVTPSPVTQRKWTVSENPPRTCACVRVIFLIFYCSSVTLNLKERGGKRCLLLGKEKAPFGIKEGISKA